MKSLPMLGKRDTDAGLIWILGGDRLVENVTYVQVPDSFEMNWKVEPRCHPG